MTMGGQRPDRTLGPGHDTFWEWCAQGQLRLQKCTSCAGLNWPVRQSCEFCGEAAFVWERLSGFGKLVSWCGFHKDYYCGLLPVPYDCILVELAEGVLFLANPAGFTVDEMALDMPVKLAFLECEDSAGSFSLPTFERA